MSRRPAAAFVARFRAAGRQQTANGVLSSSPSPQAGAAVVTAAAPAAAVYASWQPRPRRSFCSSSSRCLALGIVEQLRDSSAPAAVEAAAAARSQRWEVVQFSADGGAEETETSPEALGLHPRDVYLFDAGSALNIRCACGPIACIWCRAYHRAQQPVQHARTLCASCLFLGVQMRRWAPRAPCWRRVRAPSSSAPTPAGRWCFPTAPCCGRGSARQRR